MKPHCPLCDRIADCTALLEAYLALVSAAVALNLALNPGLMEGSRALSPLLDWLPQPAWAAAFAGMALIKCISLLINVPGWRLVSLGIGWVIWSHLAYVTAFETAQPVLGPSLYAPTSLASLVCFWAVIWRLGRDCRA